MKTKYPNETALEQEIADNAYKWKPLRTYDNLATFYSDMKDVLEGRPDRYLASTFGDKYVRNKLDKALDDIVDSYRHKAQLGRPSTTLEAVWTTYRAYIVLRTDPQHEVITWGWWQKREYERLHDLAFFVD